MGKAATEIPADKLAWYDKLVATKPEVERKGATTPYTSLNGHMFSFLTKEGTLALRLSAEHREAFLRKYETQLCEQHGRVMKEYVVVPDALLARTSQLKSYFAQSHAYVASLRPKPTTRKKSPAASKTASKATASNKTASKATASKAAASKAAASKAAASNKTASKAAASKAAASKAAASKAAASKKTASNKTANDERR